MLFISGQRYYFILFSFFVVRRLNDKEIIKELYRLARELDKMEKE